MNIFIPKIETRGGQCCLCCDILGVLTKFTPLVVVVVVVVIVVTPMVIGCMVCSDTNTLIVPFHTPVASRPCPPERRSENRRRDRRDGP